MVSLLSKRQAAPPKRVQAVKSGATVKESKQTRAHSQSAVQEPAAGRATDAVAKQALQPTVDVAEQARMIIGAGLFDREWYERQIAHEFFNEAEAAAHYISSGRRAGVSPHPLVLASMGGPRAWRTADKDPVVGYVLDQDRQLTDS
ncbi:MAG: hypothetical protein Q4G46_15560, partial [Propionibacteriaceae bacterium]|nr:hypothetical protein [Propionibacteriaceae bacterium]